MLYVFDELQLFTKLVNLAPPRNSRRPPPAHARNPKSTTE